MVNIGATRGADNNRKLGWTWENKKEDWLAVVGIAFVGWVVLAFGHFLLEQCLVSETFAADLRVWTQFPIGTWPEKDELFAKYPLCFSIMVATRVLVSMAALPALVGIFYWLSKLQRRQNMTITVAGIVALRDTLIRQTFVDRMLERLPEEQRGKEKRQEYTELAESVLKEVNEEWFTDQLPIFIGRTGASEAWKEYQDIVRV